MIPFRENIRENPCCKGVRGVMEKSTGLVLKVGTLFVLMRENMIRTKVLAQSQIMPQRSGHDLERSRDKMSER